MSDADPAVVSDNITWVRQVNMTQQLLPDGLGRVHLSLDRRTLMISAIQQDDQAVYTCSASNVAGKDSATISVTVEGESSILV